MLTEVADLSRRVCHVAHGATIIMLFVQASIEDIEGGLTAGQTGLVMAETRRLVFLCMRVRQLATIGEPQVYGEPTVFDPFDGLDDSVVRTGTTLIREATELTGADAASWLDRVRAFVADTEADLGLPEPLPVLRSPEGMFGALRWVRHWSPLVAELGLPPLLPAEWTTSSGPSAAGEGAAGDER